MSKAVFQGQKVRRQGQLKAWEQAAPRGAVCVYPHREFRLDSIDEEEPVKV